MNIFIRLVLAGIGSVWDDPYYFEVVPDDEMNRLAGYAIDRCTAMFDKRVLVRKHEPAIEKK